MTVELQDNYIGSPLEGTLVCRYNLIALNSLSLPFWEAQISAAPFEDSPCLHRHSYYGMLYQ